MTTPRSEGARLVGVAAKKVGAAEFGRRVGVTEGMIRHVVAGRKTPSAKVRERCAAEWGIVVSAWTEPPKADAPPKAPPPPTVAPAMHADRKLSGVAELRDTIELYDERIEDARHDPDTSARAWVALLRGKADACDKLAKLQGEGELTMAMVVRSRAWRDIQAAMTPILERHPDIATEIADALEALESA